jgi:hypothetical protein
MFGSTVTVAVPNCPSLVAAIVAVPAVTPVTTPVGLTVATPGTRLFQVMVLPGNTVPAASRAVALRATVWPTLTEAVEGVTATDATGTAVTVSEAVLETCPALALIVVLPTARALISP